MSFRREILPGERLLIGTGEATVAPDGRIRLLDGRRIPAVRRTLTELRGDLGLPIRRVSSSGVPLLNPDRAGQTLLVAPGAPYSDALSGLTGFDAAILLDAEDRAVRVSRTDLDARRVRTGDALLLVASEEAKPVSLVGGVAKPGAVEWAEGATLGSVVAARGGLAARALAAAITVERGGARLGPFALPQDAALALRPGDLVRVPLSNERAVYVSIAGYVKRPGLVELRPGGRLADAIADAGGLTAPADRLIVRIRTILDARRKPLLLPATELEKAPPLQRGDIVEIGAPPPKSP